MGRMYQDREMWGEAAKSFEAAIAADPKLALAWYQLGRTGAMSGIGLDRALEALEVYIEHYSDGGPPALRGGAWWRKGQILEANGDRDAALVAYERAVEINPEHEPPAASLAKLLGR